MARPSAALPLLLGLVACEHGTPFRPDSYGSDRPLVAGSPRRVTYNRGDDRAPAWLADESGFFYSLERTDRVDRDRCLGLLPPDGGRLTRVACDRSLTADSTNVLTEPAPEPHGRLIYLVAGSRPSDLAPDTRTLVLGTVLDPMAAQRLVTFPYVAPDTQRHDAASQIRWLDSTTVVFLAERIGYRRLCQGCPIDTLRSGIDIVRLRLNGPAVALDVVSDTRSASSVARGESDDVIYYTLAGDSRVFRRALSSGAVSVAYDFAGSIARDVQVVGGRLLAVVGGNVSFAYDSLLGFAVQRDGGGSLHVVDLASGTDGVLPAGGLLFRRPALSPSGRRVIAEAAPDSLADLWMYDLP